MHFKGTTQQRKCALTEVAARQYGYFTAVQAESLGYSDKHHRYHLNQENWRKVSPGLYRLPGHLDTMESEFTKWSLWSRNQQDQPQGIISHQSALAYFGLDEYTPRTVHLTVPTRFRKALPPEVVTHQASLNLSELEPKTGFMVTRLVKTLADLKPWLVERGRWEAVGAQALATQKLSPDEYRQLGFSRQISVPDVSDAEALDPAHPTLMRERIYRMIFQRTQATSTPSRRQAQAGFTLVELLVVMTIISVLAAMLLPALEKARDSARGIACANNTKQLAMAEAVYAGQYDDFTTPLTNVIASQTNVITKQWYANLLSNAEILPVSVWHNELGGDVTTGVWRCPAVGDDQISWGGGYGPNEKHTMMYTKSLRLGALTVPARLWLFGDVHQNHYRGVTTWKTWVASFCPQCCDWVAGQYNQAAPRHGGQTNVVFFDGHAAAVPWNDLLTNKDDAFGHSRR